METIVLELRGTLVNQVDSLTEVYYKDYDFSYNKEKALKIIRMSIEPYPVKTIVLKKGKAIVTIEGKINELCKVATVLGECNETGIVDDIVVNYGDRGPDTWMLQDIMFDDFYELWLDVDSIKFYKNGKEYLDKKTPCNTCEYIDGVRKRGKVYHNIR